MTIILALATTTAGAAEPEVDRQERTFGATRINAALGHGRLTVGVSHAGELTVLRWPNPSFYEHLNYTTAGGADARKKPLFGAAPNEGSFAGLALRTGQEVKLTWLRDEALWTHEQSYVSDSADTLRTRYRSAALKLTVEGTDVVDPRRDVLARRFKVTPDGDAALDDITLVYFENLAPNVEKGPFVPLGAHTDDDKRDYALVYDAAHDALLHGSVDGRPSGPLEKLPGQANEADVKSYLAAIAGLKGVFVAVGASSQSSGHQCGLDAVDGAGSVGPEDAYDDAADGALSGSPAAIRHATGALGFALGASGGEVTVYLAVGRDAAGASAALEAARKAGFTDAEQASSAAWAAWLQNARLPETTDADRLRVARRALITIRTATAPETGAVVASIATQPGYAEDWPRDGAFINYALDVAGKHDAVTLHNQTYAGWQREKEGEDVLGGARAPAGSFAMNYYADGVPAGFIPFEIDQVGLVLWSFYSHATFLADHAARDAYLASVWPALKRSADLLVSCKDPVTGLQCAANEDDDIEQTISLHGTAPAVLGLRCAIRAARYLGHTDDAGAWLERLRELERSVETHLHLGGAGYTGIVAGQPTEIWPPWRRTGALAWAVWPAELAAQSSAPMRETAAEVQRQLEPFFDKQNNGGAYHAKGTLALAMHAHDVDDPATLDRVRRWIDTLVKEVAIPGTDHFGEAYVYEDLDGDGDREYENRVAIPHVWEAALVYLSLMAAYSPERLQPEALAEVEPAAGGCCRVGGPNDTPAAGGLVLLLFLLLRYSRRPGA